MSIALRARQPPSRPTHGQFLYLYSHLKTNQVIYSLQREINTEKSERALLKQLTFYGKKTVPTKLRRDFWRPFAIVTFPKPEDGLHVYKTLREYRIVRDHSWTFAPIAADLAAAETKANESKFDELAGGLEAGKKAEEQDPTKYSKEYKNVLEHYTRWPDRGERAKLLQDQRATSVADLADIITRYSNKNGDLKEIRARRDAEKYWVKIKALANTPQVAVDKMEAERAAYVPSTVHNQTFREKQKTRLRDKHMGNITLKVNRIRKAREAVAFAAGAEIPEALRKKWSYQLQRLVQTRTGRQVMPPRPAKTLVELPEGSEEAATPEPRPKNWPPAHHTPKPLTNRERIAGVNRVQNDSRLDLAIPLDQTLIQWISMPDANYAATWPANVVHGDMPDRWTTKAERRIAKAEAAAEAEGDYEDVEYDDEGVEEDFGKYAEEAAKEPEMMREEPKEKGLLSKLDPRTLFGGKDARA